MKTRATLLICLASGILTSCGNPDVRLRYEAEKLYYEADKAASAATSIGGSQDPAVSRTVRDQFGKVAEFCFTALDSVPSGTKEHRQLSIIAFASSSRLVGMFLDSRRFDTCATLLERILALPDIGKGEQEVTWYNYGRVIQLSGHWDSAQTIFINALAKFAPPVDDRGQVQLVLLNLPLRIHRALAEAGDAKGAKFWFDFAQEYYQKWSQANGKPNALSMMSTGNLARLYEDAGMWERSAQMLVAMKGPDGKTAPEPNRHLADLYVEQLNRPEEALAIYDELYGQLQGADTAGRPMLVMKKSLAYISKKDWAKARELLTQISTRWRGFYSQTPSAQYNKAKCFEMENNWERAESEYRFLIDNYPGSADALSAYLYLAQKIGEMGRATESKQWYERAEKAFDDLAVRGAGTGAEAMALYYKADLYRQREQWPLAAETLQKVFERFPNTEPGQRAGLMAIDVYRKQLNNNRTADSLGVVYQQTLLNAQTDSASRSDL
ncbi:MAG: tetratricopeptide repeat protein [candidate division Zixibacteria bacterium]|nr:tetratricopeptide repeat protein [candidate division Zixibacteria bacterium]